MLELWRLVIECWFSYSVETYLVIKVYANELSSFIFTDSVVCAYQLMTSFIFIDLVIKVPPNEFSSFVFTNFQLWYREIMANGSKRARTFFNPNMTIIFSRNKHFRA
ncbi:hypothetical protein ES332_D04G079000v1, partial [Gossypium tomentosum]